LTIDGEHGDGRRMDFDDEGTRPYQIRLGPKFWAGVDDWRRRQEDIPTRAEAIRRLVEIGLQAENAPPDLFTRRNR
jgi:hypothetical protein